MHPTENLERSIKRYLHNEGFPRPIIDTATSAAIKSNKNGDQCEIIDEAKRMAILLAGL